MMGDTVLRLVPSNWFYNLSVYGFLKVLSSKNGCGIKLEEEGIFKEDGSIEINLKEHGILEETEEIAPGVRSVRLWDCYTKVMFERKPISPFTDFKEKKDTNFLFQLLKQQSNDKYVEKLYSLTVKVLEKLGIKIEDFETSDPRIWFSKRGFKTSEDLKKAWKDLVEDLNKQIELKLAQVSSEKRKELKELIFEADKTFWQGLDAIDTLKQEYKASKSRKKNQKKMIDDLERQIRFIYKMFLKRFAVNLIKARYDDFLFTKGGEFENLINVQNENYRFITPILIKLLDNFLGWYQNNQNHLSCQFCGEYPFIEQFIKYLETQKEHNLLLKKKWSELKTVLQGLALLNIRQIKLLAPSADKFPNSFWNLNSSVPLCLVCNILFLFYPLGLIDIGNGQRIFANAPSFELIWKLNQHLEKIHSKGVYEDIKTLFGVAFIDLVLDLNVKLGLWQRLSTEVIVFKGQDIDFYEIPPQILELLEDKRISSLIASLNNPKILDVFLSGNFKLLEVLIYRLLRSAGSDKEDKLLKEFNLSYKPETVETMSKLYALSVSKLKKTAEVEV